ncbi:MAG: MFS transporter [Caldilinea sp.]|uniref:MFS transporter n=1 Tax=Caldilinea sp. TaxID=2293560 RepID=UPI002C99A746|nr:MFS transporter [Caldilinea sp.]
MKTLEHPDQQSTPEGEDAVDSRPASISPVAHGVKVEMLDPPLNPQLPPEVAPMRARQARRIETFRALQHRNFQLYLFGQLVSLAGTWMQIVAQGWLVYELSRSEAMLGVVGFASAIPALIVTPWAGVIIDQVRKRDVIVMTQVSAMLLAFVLAFLTFTGTVQVWHIIVLAVVLGVINAFDGPARQSFVVEMVGSNDLSNAIALNSMTFNAARVVGPAFGGILLATVGSAWCFTFNGLSFLAVIISLLAMRIASERTVTDRRSPWQQLQSGLRYVAGKPEMKGLLMLSLAFSTFGIAYNTVLPAFADRILNGGAVGFGLLTAAAGIGAVTGAFLVATYGDRGQRGQWLFYAAMSFPVVLGMFALNRNFPAALLLAALLGVGFMLQFTLINTLLQTRVTNEMRGRVMSLYTLTFFGFTPFGNLALGALSQAIGMNVAILLFAVLTFGASLVVFRLTPQLRRLA